MPSEMTVSSTLHLNKSVSLDIVICCEGHIELCSSSAGIDHSIAFRKPAEVEASNTQELFASVRGDPKKVIAGLKIIVPVHALTAPAMAYSFVPNTRMVEPSKQCTDLPWMQALFNSAE